MRKNRIAVLEKLKSKAPELPEIRIEHDGTRTARMIGIAVIAAAVIMLAMQWPELRRYMRMRSM